MKKKEKKRKGSVIVCLVGGMALLAASTVLSPILIDKGSSYLYAHRKTKPVEEDDDWEPVVVKNTKKE